MTPSVLLLRHRLLLAAAVRRKGLRRRPPFRPPKPSGPIAAYTTVLNRVLDGLNTKIAQVLQRAGLGATWRQDSPADGSDGLPILPSQQRRVVAALDDLARNPITRDELIGPLDDVAAQTTAFSRAQFQRVIRAALGLDVTVGDPHLAAQAAAFRTHNLGLIRTLADDHIARVRTVLDTAGVGTRVEDIADSLRDAVGITKRHAALIARDQVLKYNARVTRARHEEAGIDAYTWRTSEDERVRESHQALDGQVFAYSDPPTDDDSGEAVNPGDAIQCRCTADPVIPGYDTDDERADGAEVRVDYDPNQERDERGRFGSGGGPAPTLPSARTSATADPINPPPYHLPHPPG